MLTERRIAVFGVISAVITFCLCFCVIGVGGLRPGNLEAALPGTVAPEIASRDVDNHLLELSAFRGRCVLVYFAPDLSSAIVPNDDDSGLKPGSDSTPVVTVADQAADLERLSVLSHALDASQVTVLENRRSNRADPMNLISLVAQADGEAARVSRMLLDSDGEIARRFKVDSYSARPTLFVIDSNGVIRYRGTCAEASAEKLARELGMSAPTSSDTASSESKAGRSRRPAIGAVDLDRLSSAQ